MFDLISEIFRLSPDEVLIFVFLLPRRHAGLSLIHTGFMHQVLKISVDWKSFNRSRLKEKKSNLVLLRLMQLCRCA